jgi:catalase
MKGEGTMEKKSGSILTTAFGIPVANDLNSMTAGKRAAATAQGKQ